MRVLKTLVAGAIVATATSFSSAYAHEAYVRTVGSAACETPQLIEIIKSKFKTQAKRVHHRPEWRIDEISGVHQHRYIPQDVHGTRAIAQRYCHATATFNTGEHRKIWYLVEGGVGFAGFGLSWLGSKRGVQKALGDGGMIHNVEFCIDGLDRWNVYNGHCRLLR
ncbi:MAG: hypothetical protein AAFY99_03350 [Pseudomonadota bacterium]